MRVQRLKQRDLFEAAATVPQVPDGARASVATLVQALLIEASAVAQRIGAAKSKENGDDQDHA